MLKSLLFQKCALNEILMDTSGLPRWLSGEESTCSAEETGWSPGSGRSPGGGSHGQRSLAGYSPWVAESDMTEATEHVDTPI